MFTSSTKYLEKRSDLKIKYMKNAISNEALPSKIEEIFKIIEEEKELDHIPDLLNKILHNS